jgi:hypothetical protein
MSFTLNRDNKLVVKKNLSINNAVNTNNLSASIGSTGITTIASLTTLSLDNAQITVPAERINTLAVTKGIAEPSKALILDVNKDLTGINRISCNVLIAGGQNITLSLFSSSTSDDINNQYLTSTTIGYGSANKALILDENKNIDNINTLSINTLITNNNKIISGTKNSTIKLQTIHNVVPNFQNLNLEYKSITQYQRISTVGANSTRFNTLNWNSVCWSPELSLFVMVANGFVSGTTAPNGVRVAVSKDGFNWTMYTTIDNDWQDVIWISKLRLFVAVSSSGTGNRIMTSSDGINWTARNSAGDYNWVQLCWAESLNLCLAINTTNGFIMYSNDCINWFMTQTDSTNAGLKKICWAPELNLFVAITNSQSANSFLISSNGMGWNSISSVNGASVIWHDLKWSPYLKMFLASSQQLSNRSISYSYDGYNWFNSYQNLVVTTFIWADNLHLWLGFSRLINQNMAYSADGKHWLDFTIETDANKATFNSVVWSNELGILVCCMSSTTNTITKRIITIQPNTIGNKPSLILNKNIIQQDLDNNRIGIQTYTPNRPLEINSESGKVLKLYSELGTFSSSFNLTNNGQLNIDANIVNILTDYSTYGLKLNGTLINTSVDLLNNISSNTSVGAVESNKIIEFDSNRNISNLNILSCNSLTVNGVVQQSSNNAYFQNSVIGTVVANSSITPDSNNNISNFNNISLKTYNLNNNLIQSDKLNDTITLNAYSKKNYLDTINNMLPLAGNFSISSDGSSVTDIAWSPKLKKALSINLNSTNNQDRIRISNNHIIEWRSAYINASLLPFSICWSNELSLWVITHNTGIMYSSTGTSWTSSFIPVSDSYRFVIWCAELSLFIARSLTTNTSRILVSSNGIRWILVNTLTNITSGNLCWAPELSLIIYATGTAGNSIYLSSDGYTWSNSNIIIESSANLNYITWSPDLKMFIGLLSSSTNIYYYSYNGYNWYKGILPTTTTYSRSIWVSELKTFIVIGSTNIFYSNNGKDWLLFTQTPNSNILITWIPEYNKLVTIDSSGRISHSSLYTKFNYNNSLLSQNNAMTVNTVNGNVGLGGITPTFQLHLSTDSAAKPTSSTWSVSSDERLKEDIVPANLEICYNNFKNTNLVKYKWKDSNKQQLGWIAQQVETIFPKAITTTNYKNIEDCKFLNNDQINATMYGALQYLINEIEQDSEKINLITNSLNDIENTLNSLVIE